MLVFGLRIPMIVNDDAGFDYLMDMVLDEVFDLSNFYADSNMVST